VDRIFIGLLKEHYSESIRQKKDLYFSQDTEGAFSKAYLKRQTGSIAVNGFVKVVYSPEIGDFLLELISLHQRMRHLKNLKGS
jgi:hypothetical protein